jgi:hypothetical protein
LAGSQKPNAERGKVIMPFDPTKPGNGTLISAAELRAQFNSLKTLLDALNARVTALENPPAPGTHTASGFGDAATNGALTEIGNYNGALLYSTPGGRFVWRGGMSAPWTWQIRDEDPRINAGVALYVGNHDEVAGSYSVVVGIGIAPAGTIS